jgi:hypothetical protein
VSTHAQWDASFPSLGASRSRCAPAPSNKTLQLTRRRRSACQGFQPPAARVRGGLAGRPPVVTSWCTGGGQLSAGSLRGNDPRIDKGGVHGLRAKRERNALNLNLKLREEKVPE